MLNVFWKMSSYKLKEILKKFKFEKLNNFSFKNVTITKLKRNEVPFKIELSFYDLITITEQSIHFHPEHGPPIELLNFEKVRKLNRLIQEVQQWNHGE